MSVLFWYLLKSDLSSVRYCTLEHWISPFVQGTRNTWSCINGQPEIQNYVNYVPSGFVKVVEIRSAASPHLIWSQVSKTETVQKEEGGGGRTIQ